MDAKLKAKWVKALRSGKYKQARNRLTNGRGYCCIGVLGVVAKLKFDSDTSTTFVGFRCGLADNDIGHLVTMNDHDFRRFKTIANYIEANL